MARGPIALPERGIPTSPADQGSPQAGGNAGPYYWRSDAWTAEVPLPVGPLYGPDTRADGTFGPPGSRPYQSPVLPIVQADSDAHCTDPAIIRSVALPQRGRYGSDSRLVGPFVGGGNRDTEGESRFRIFRQNRRRTEVQSDALVPFVRGTEIDWLASPDHLTRRMPYYRNDGGQRGYSAPTVFSWTANETVSGGEGTTDPGPVHNKRYDSFGRYQWYGAESQRYEDAFVSPQGRALHSTFQRGRNYAKRRAHPTMTGGYSQLLAQLAETISVGSLTEPLM